MTPSEIIVGFSKSIVSKLFQLAIPKNYLPWEKLNEFSLWKNWNDVLPKNATFWIFLSVGLLMALIKLIWGFSWCCKKCKKSEFKSENTNGFRYYSGLFLFTGLLVLATLATILIFAANKVFIKGVENFPTQLDNTKSKILALPELKANDSLIEKFKSNIKEEVKSIFEGAEFSKVIGILDDLENIHDDLNNMNYTTNLKTFKTKIQDLKSKIPDSSSGILADFESTLNLDFDPQTILDSELLKNLRTIKSNLTLIKSENVLDNLNLAKLSSENIGNEVLK